MKNDAACADRPVPPVFLRDSSECELECFVELERDPDTAPFILPASLQQHRADLARPGQRYLTVSSVPDGQAVGFMILILEPDGLGLRRMVIGPKGRGYGRSALAALEALYVRQGCKRIWLDVFADNLRARRFYERAGYRLEQQADFFGRPLLIYEKGLSGQAYPAKKA